MVLFSRACSRAPRRVLSLLALVFTLAAGLATWPTSALAAQPPVQLRACPDPERLITVPQAATRLWSERQSYDALCLYMASMGLARTDAVKATDLYVLGRARSRFDLLRCETWPHGPMSSATASMRMGAEQALNTAGVTTFLPQLIAVMQLPSTYDYEFDDLEQMCDGGALKPEKDWKAEQERMQAGANAAAAEARAANSSPSTAPKSTAD
jgi:hypothetical protein